MDSRPTEYALHASRRVHTREPRPFSPCLFLSKLNRKTRKERKREQLVQRLKRVGLAVQTHRRANARS